MRQYKVLRTFPYSSDGATTETYNPGWVRPIRDDLAPGLEAGGYITKDLDAVIDPSLSTVPDPLAEARKRAAKGDPNYGSDTQGRDPNKPNTGARSLGGTPVPPSGDGPVPGSKPSPGIDEKADPARMTAGGAAGDDDKGAAEKPKVRLKQVGGGKFNVYASDDAKAEKPLNPQPLSKADAEKFAPTVGTLEA